jgi:5-methylcytosine-specific restriction endonuclease McrA
MRKKENKFKKSLKKKLIKKQNGLCKNGCIPTKENYLEGHHIIPVSEGGFTTEENFLLLCKRCHLKEHCKN